MINPRIISPQQEIGQKPEVANPHTGIEHLLKTTESLTESISPLKASIAQKKQTLQQLETQNAAFPQKISEKEAAIAQTSEDITAKLLSEIDSANTQLATLKIELVNTTKEISNTSNTVTDLIDQKKQLSREISSLAANKTLNTAKINELKEQKLSTENSIKLTKNELHALKHKKINILTKILLICFVVVGWIILAIKHHNNEKHNTATNKKSSDLKKTLEGYTPQLPKLAQEITEKTNELKKINQEINQNNKSIQNTVEQLETLETLITHLKEQKNKLSTKINQQDFDIAGIKEILEQVNKANPNLVNLKLSREIIAGFETLKQLEVDHGLLKLQQGKSLDMIQTVKKSISTQEAELSNLERNLSDTELLISGILNQQEQNLPLFPPQPEHADHQLQQFPPAEIMQSSALIHPHNYATVDCKSEHDVENYLIKLGITLKGLNSSEVKQAIKTAKDQVNYKSASLDEKYNVLLSCALHILNFPSQEQLLYRASDLNNVADNKSEDYGRAHVYYSWVFEKLIEEIAPQSKSYEVQVPTNYKDQFRDVVNAASSNAYPLDQLKNHSARAVNFFANITTLETRLAEKNPNLLLHSYYQILEANFEKLSRDNLSEKDLNEVLDLIVLVEQTEKRSELKNVLTKVITDKTKDIINKACEEQGEQAIKQQMLSILLETNISNILENILLHPDYANLNVDLNTINEKELENIAYEVFNKLNEKIENKQIDKSSLQTLHNQMKPIYQEQLHQQQEQQSDRPELLNGLKIMRLTDIGENDQADYNEIENQLKNVRTQYEEFTTQYLALTEKINNSEKLNYNELAELENEISTLKFNPNIPATYNTHIRNICRTYKSTLSTQKLDSLDFSILDQNQAPEQAIIAAQVANSIVIPEELNGFLGKGINPDQLLFDASGDESLEVDNSRRGVLTQFATLHSTLNKAEKELRFYNAMKDELSALSKLHKINDKSNDLKLNNANNTKIEASIVNNWDNLDIDTIRTNIRKIAMEQANSHTVLLWKLNPGILEAKINDYISAIIYENGTTKGLPDWAINHLVNHSDFMMESNPELTKYIFSLRGLPESWAQFIKYDADKRHFYLVFGGSNNTSDAGHKCFHRVIETLATLYQDAQSKTILDKIADKSALNPAELEYMKAKYPEKNTPKKKLADNNQQDIRTVTEALYNLKTRNVTAVTVGANEINGAYYEKIFCDILVTIKDQYSMKKAAESVTILSELSKAIYALHDVGNFAKNKHAMLASNLDNVTSLVNKLKSNLPNISGELDKILKVATSVKNTKAS